MTTPIDEAALVKEYTPVLVLYPEIPTGTSRPDIQEYPRVSPLSHDYHPRSIAMVLEHCNFHKRWGWPNTSNTYLQGEMLERMETAKYRRNLDILPGVSRKNRQRFWADYANIPKSRDDYRRVCYAQVVRGDGESLNKDQIIVQYWYAYFYNDFWNAHEMDWETVMVVFQKVGNKAQPRICAYSAHTGGYWLPWPQVEKAERVGEDLIPASDGTHPIVYVANGSHANYFNSQPVFWATPPKERQIFKLLAPIIAGLTRPLTWVSPNSEISKMLKSAGAVFDFTKSWGDGDRHLVEALPIADAVNGQWTGDWRWLNQKGTWGSPEEVFLPGSGGPHGPPQTGQKWDDPFRWIDNNCELAPSHEGAIPPTMWQP